MVAVFERAQSGRLLPSQNPYMMLRLFAGVQEKINNIIANGMINTKNERIVDGGLSYITEGAPIDDNAAIKKYLSEISQSFAEDTLSEAQKATKDRIVLSDAQKVTKERIRKHIEAVNTYMAESGMPTKTVEDVVVNLVVAKDGVPVLPAVYDWTGRMVEAADKNRAHQAIVTMIDAMSEGGSTDPRISVFGHIVAHPLGNKTITVHYGNRQLHLLMNEELKFALDSWLKEDRGAANVLESGARVLSKILRYTITKVPVGSWPFMVRNIIRDAQQRFIVTSSELGVPSDIRGITAGIKEVIKQTEEMGLWQLSGGDMVMRQKGMDEPNLFDMANLRKQYAANMSAAISKSAQEKRNWFVASLFATGRAAKKTGQFIHNLPEASERLGRLREFHAVYVAVLKDMQKVRTTDGTGLTEQEAKTNAAVAAAFASRDLLDFSLRGSRMRGISSFIPFLNAQIQGLSKTARTLLNPRNPRAMVAGWAKVAFLGTLLSYTVRAFSKGLGYEEDDEYEQLPNYRKDLFYNIKVGPDTWIAIPKPFEIGVLSSIGERLLWGDATYKASDTVQSLVQAVFGVDAGSLAGSYKPLVEAATNYSFFTGGQIIPDSEKNLDFDIRQHSDNATPIGEGVSIAMNWTLDKLYLGGGVDPRVVDHLVYSLTGTTGSTVKRAIQRAERGQPLFWDNLLGLAKDLSGVMSRGTSLSQKDASDVLDIVQKYRLQGILKDETQYLYHLANKYRASNDAAERDAINKRIREVTKRMETVLRKNEQKIKEARIKEMQMKRRVDDKLYDQPQ
jgi:hypothetical protein